MSDPFPARDARDVALTDRAIFIADGADGLRVYDRLAALTADLTGIFHGLRITLAGDTAFITGPPLGAESDGSHSIWAIDVADPFRPVLRGHLALPTGSVTGNDWTDPPHALVNEDMILVTVPDRGIAVFRLADGGPLPASRLALPVVAVAR